MIFVANSRRSTEPLYIYVVPTTDKNLSAGQKANAMSGDAEICLFSSYEALPDASAYCELGAAGAGSGAY